MFVEQQTYKMVMQRNEAENDEIVYYDFLRNPIKLSIRDL